MLERMRRALVLAPLACAAIYACGGGDTEPTMTGPPAADGGPFAGTVTDFMIVP